MGYFPSALVRPTLALDINMLEFVAIGLHSEIEYYPSITKYLVCHKVRAFLIRVLYDAEESFRTQTRGVSEVHCIGIEFSLRWQTRKSINRSGIRPLP